MNEPAAAKTGYQAVVFDLDGTLLDTLEDLADSANAMLMNHGFPVHPVDDYKLFIGDGMLKLVERILPPGAITEETALLEMVEKYKAEYSRRWNAKSRPFEGIAELLDELIARGIRLGVLSNKAHPFTVRCVESLAGAWPWGAILGQRDGVPKKPDPAGALEIAEQLGVRPEECLYIGDSGVDMQTARASGMFAVGVLWGFRDEEELREAGAQRLISHPREVLSLLA